jgi:hypothetical protein
MACIQGEGRSQGTLFPVVLDDLVPSDHMCRVCKPKDVKRKTRRHCLLNQGKSNIFRFGPQCCWITVRAEITT